MNKKIRNKIKTKEIIQQQVSECGAICLAIITSHYGDDFSLAYLREICGIGRDGASVSDIQKGAHKINYSCDLYKKGLQAIKNVDIPIIIHWDMNHYVVFEGYRDHRFYINDPAVGRRSMNEHDFAEHYTGISVVIKPIYGKVSNYKQEISDDLTINFADGDKNYISYMICINFIRAFFNVCIAILMMLFFDYIVNDNMTEWNMWLISLAALVVIVKLVLSHLFLKYSIYKEELMKINFKSKYLDLIFSDKSDTFDLLFPSEVITNIGLMDKYLDFICEFYRKGYFAIISSIIILLLIFPVQPLLVSMFLIGFMFNTFFTWKNKYANQELMLQYNEIESKYNIEISRRLSSYIKFYSMGLQRILISSMLPSINNKLVKKFKMDREAAIINGCRDVLLQVSMPLGLLVGSYLLVNGEISYGGYVIVLCFSLMLLDNLKVINGIIEKYLYFKKYSNMFRYFLYEMEEEKFVVDDDEDDKIIVPKDVLLSVRNFSFGFKINENTQNDYPRIDFDIKKGEVFILDGESGSGKSTLINTILGIRSKVSGAVYKEGIKLKPKELKAGYVFADEYSVEGSLVEFISCNLPVDNDKIAKILDMVMLTKRLGYFVNGDGHENLKELNLSIGEIQRLFLAQAIYFNREIVFFDEGFSNVSVDQAARIINNMKEYGVTLIMSTHRRELMVLADNIYKL